MDLEDLAEMAKQAALAGTNVKIALPWDWQRPHGFAFPAVRPKREDADAEGYAIWEWRSYSVLLFVHEQVAGSTSTTYEGTPK